MRRGGKGRCAGWESLPVRSRRSATVQAVESEGYKALRAPSDDLQARRELEQPSLPACDLDSALRVLAA